MPCVDGTSILLMFDSISKCAEYLVLCANARHAIQLSMWKLVVTKMQQYQYRDKVLKFPIKTPQNKFEPSATLSKKEHQSITTKPYTSKIQNGFPYGKNTEDKITHSPIQNKDSKRLNDRKKRNIRNLRILPSSGLNI